VGVSAEKLARAGFYYEEKADFVRCFYCNGGIMDWKAEDNPYLKHAQQYSDCSYIRTIMGEVFMERAAEYVDLLPSFTLGIDETPNDWICNMCYSHVARVILFPCGHQGGCGNCANEHDNCPYCRKEVTGRVLVKF
jgi:hypothetical protein